MTMVKETLETIHMWLRFDKESLDTTYVTLDFLLDQLQEHLKGDNKDLVMNILNSIRWWVKRLKNTSERMQYTIELIERHLD